MGQKVLESTIFWNKRHQTERRRLEKCSRASLGARCRRFESCRPDQNPPVFGENRWVFLLKSSEFQDGVCFDHIFDHICGDFGIVFYYAPLILRKCKYHSIQQLLHASPIFHHKRLFSISNRLA